MIKSSDRKACGKLLASLDDEKQEDVIKAFNHGEKNSKIAKRFAFAALPVKPIEIRHKIND